MRADRSNKKMEGIFREYEKIIHGKKKDVLQKIFQFLQADVDEKDILKKAEKVADKIVKCEEVSCVPPELHQLKLSEDADFSEMAQLLEKIQLIAMRSAEPSFAERANQVSREIALSGIDLMLNTLRLLRTVAIQQGVGLHARDLFEGLEKLLNTSVSLIERSMSFSKSLRMLNFDEWFENELKMYKHMEKARLTLSSIRETQFQHMKTFNELELKEIEKHLFGEDLAYEFLSINKYRELMKSKLILNPFMREKFGLSADEKLTDEEYSKHFLNLIFQLETHHLSRKMYKSENDMIARLAVWKDQHPTKDTTQFDKTISLHGDVNNGSLKKVLTGEIEKSGEHEARDEIVRNDLAAKVLKRRKRLTANCFLLVAVCLGVAATICAICALASVFVPPAGLLIGLAVGSLAAIAIAKYFNRDVVKDLTEGFKQSFRKFNKQYTFWKEAKEKGPITPTLLPTTHK